MNKHPLRTLTAWLCLIPAVLLLCGLALPPQYGDTYLGEMQDKLVLLRETPGPRIIVIGGSSVPFALQTAAMNEALPAYHTVDFGLYADMGLIPMLAWAQAEVRAGDLVILMPEQDAQMLSCYVGGESLWQACDGSFAQLTAIPAEHWGALASAFPVFAGKKLRYALTGSPQADGVYAHSSFNAYGDIDCAGRERNILPGGAQSNQTICFDPMVPGEDFVRAVTRFADAASTKGAQVVWHFPPMNAAAVTASREEIDAWYDGLASRLSLPILGDPHRCVLDSGWFFDSNFHLNESGAAVFTELMIRDIKVYLRDPSQTTAALMEMPEAAQTAYAGDNSCESAFLYAEAPEGWVIAGLTEDGKQAGQLTLPAAHDGQPVFGILAETFRDDRALREVTIGPNIAMLPDAMFSGCTALRQVTLLSDAPSAFSVGDGWMQGASFLIRVPSASLDAWRRSYFWQQYEPWLRAME